jgi:hypothetical protein
MLAHRDRGQCGKSDSDSRTIRRVDLDAFGATLRSGERLFVCVPIDGFLASRHSVLAPTFVGLSNQRYVVYAKRGVMKKRYEEMASWPLTDFTSRMNSNEGSALGSYLYFLTLFTNTDEKVSAGFDSSAQRDDFMEKVQQTFENGFE